MKKLTVVQIAPTEESVPPQKYGGTELVVHNITKELVKRGHKVYLLASGNSKTSAQLVPIFPQNLRSFIDMENKRLVEVSKFIGIAKIIKAVNQLKDVDIIHNHYNWRVLAFSDSINKPIINTMHGPLGDPNLKMAYENFKNGKYISISNYQRKGLPMLNYVNTVYNGIDINLFHFYDSDERGKYLAFLGRTSPEKGIRESVIITKEADVKLKIAAKVDAVDKKYFEKEVKPLIDGEQIEFMGEIESSEKSDFLGSAAALLSPINWEEPFGLFFVESMACGTPVVAFARGSVPEIIKDGETGFIVNSSEKDKRGDWIIKKTGIDGMVEAVNKVYNMPKEEYERMRRNCRRHVERNFTAEKMAEEYEKVYYKILEKHGKK